jgi:hypothetical protein
MSLSPAKAAEIAGCSRSLISKEVKAGNLHGSKNNATGHITIKRPDLDDWMSRRTKRRQKPDKPSAEPVKSHDGDIRIAALEVEVREVRTQLDRALQSHDDMRQDRDDWKKQAQDLSQARRGIFRRIFG